MREPVRVGSPSTRTTFSHQLRSNQIYLFHFFFVFKFISSAFIVFVNQNLNKTKQKFPRRSPSPQKTHKNPRLFSIFICVISWHNRKRIVTNGYGVAMTTLRSRDNPKKKFFFERRKNRFNFSGVSGWWYDKHFDWKLTAVKTKEKVFWVFFGGGGVGAGIERKAHFFFSVFYCFCCWEKIGRLTPLVCQTSSDPLVRYVSSAVRNECRPFNDNLNKMKFVLPCYLKKKYI